MFKRLKAIAPFFYSPEGANESGKTDEKIIDGADKTETVETDVETIESHDSATDKNTEPDPESLEGMEIELEKAKSKLFDPGKTGENKTDDSSKEKPEASGQAGKTEKDNLGKAKFVKVDDEFINKASEEDKEFLQSIKGESLSEKAIKIHVNAQKYIKQLKEGTATPETLKAASTQVKPMSNDQITEAKNNMIYNQIAARFSDFPKEGLTDPEARDDYERVLFNESPSKHREFTKLFEDSATRVDQWEKGYRDLSTTWEDRASAQITAGVDTFTEELKKHGLSPKDLGIEFTDQWILQNLIYKNDGKPDENVVRFQHNIPIVLPNAVGTKLIQNFLPQIIEATKTQARKEALEGKEKLTPNPSISNSNLSAKDKISKDTLLVDDNSSLAEIEAAIEQEKVKLFGPDGKEFK